MTPTWAKPRAAPPPNAKPILMGFLIAGSDGAGLFMATGGAAQPVSTKPPQAIKQMRIIRVRNATMGFFKI